MKFRSLKANEIECRVGTVSSKGVSVLLYKDARCDMHILDEVVGCCNWERKHKIIDDQLFCTVSIFDGEKWINKEDVGTKSNAEEEKGRASDSFKRACFNWGIGRELYTAPFIFIPCKTEQVGKSYKLSNKFEFKDLHVAKIGYDENNSINELVLKCNDKVVFNFKNKSKSDLTDLRKQVVELLKDTGMSKEEILKILKGKYNVENTKYLTKEQCLEIIGKFKGVEIE